MNQANEDSNIVIAGIQAVETERGIEAPVYKKGPKMIAIRMGQDVQEILTKTSRLLEARENRKVKSAEKVIPNKAVETRRARKVRQEDERAG